MIGLAVASRSDPVRDSRRPAPVVFVCRDGVAMSVWSAAYFNRLAGERGLRERAVARAALPSFREVPLRMRFALALDGFRLDGYRPQVIDAADGRNAELVVVIDTVLPSEALASDDDRSELCRGSRRCESSTSRLGPLSSSASRGRRHAAAPTAPSATAKGDVQEDAGRAFPLRVIDRPTRGAASSRCTATQCTFFSLAWASSAERTPRASSVAGPFPQ